jgi:hypothetical protein
LLVDWEFIKSLANLFEFVEFYYLMGDVRTRDVFCGGDYEFHVFAFAKHKWGFCRVKNYCWLSVLYVWLCAASPYPFHNIIQLGAKYAANMTSELLFLVEMLDKFRFLAYCDCGWVFYYYP